MPCRHIGFTHMVVAVSAARWPERRCRASQSAACQASSEVAALRPEPKNLSVSTGPERNSRRRGSQFVEAAAGAEPGRYGNKAAAAASSPYRASSERLRGSQHGRVCRLQGLHGVVTPKAPPNPSLERTLRGKAPRPRGAAGNLAPRGRGALPLRSAQLKR